MSVRSLIAWLQANPTEPTDAAFHAEGVRTVADAIRERHFAALAEVVSRVRPTTLVARGRVSATEFNAEYTPQMDALLTANERRTLQGWLTTAGEVDLSAPAVQPVAVKLGYRLTRAGSLAEEHLGRERVDHNEVSDHFAAEGQPRKRVEEVLAVAPDGALERVRFEDAVEVDRIPDPDKRRIPAARVRPNMTEGDILRALEA